MTCIVLVTTPEGAIAPIVNDDGDTCAQYPDRAAAHEAMKETTLAIAYGYDIVDMDDL